VAGFVDRLRRGHMQDGTRSNVSFTGATGDILTKGGSCLIGNKLVVLVLFLDSGGTAFWGTARDVRGEHHDLQYTG